jgi:hypothetical protein
MRLLFPLILDIRLFLCLYFGFIISTIIGTVSHELGHYAVAKSLGYSSSVSYAYSTWDDDKTRPFLDSVFSKYYLQIKSNLEFPEKEKFKRIQRKQNKDDFWIILGGPFQTVLTGTIGFILLLSQRKLRNTNGLKLIHWVLIFLSLFWLRQLANLVTWIIEYFIHGSFSSRGDEIRLAASLGFAKSTIAVPTALIGLAILSYIIFKIIPKSKRLTFITAGLFGGISGYFLWLFWLGPIIIP